MSTFLKQFIFVSTIIAILMIGGLVVNSALPSGFIKMKPSSTAKIKMVNQENTTTTGNNPVGWWKFDEETASTTYDVSGNGSNGTTTGGVLKTTGKLGKSLLFDGVNDYVNVTTTSNILDMPTNNFSFSVWIKNTHTGAIQYVAAKAAAYNSLGYAFYLGSTGAPSFGLNDGTDTYYSFGTANIVNNGLWHQVVWVINGRGTTAANRIYIDGISRSLSAFGSWANIDSISNNLSFNVGCTTVPNACLDANIDDVRIYNRELSAGEVEQMWSSTKDGYLGNIKISTGIISYLKMDEASWATSVGATAVVKDLSGKLNNGTPYNHASTTAGQIGKAGIFDGIDDYVSANANRSDLMAVSFWIKPNSTTQSILELNATNSIAVTSGVVQATGFGTPTIYVDGVSTTSLPNTSWHFITINPTIKMAGNGLNLGKVSTSYYAGLLDDFKIYSKVLSSTEIQNNYIRGASGREQ